jgi:sterol desaturase/sphingolipid hydroxylase (fatty acid hydroxylase superfamily)
MWKIWVPCRREADVLYEETATGDEVMDTITTIILIIFVVLFIITIWEWLNEEYQPWKGLYLVAMIIEIFCISIVILYTFFPR